MTYRFQLRRSPRSVLLPLAAVLLIAGSIALVIFVEPIIGVIALGISAYVSYHIIKFFVFAVNSQIKVHDDGIVCKTSLGSQVRFTWETITIAGWYYCEDGSRLFYVYAEEDDELISLPETYERMDELGKEVAEHVELVELKGFAAEDLTTVLKERLFPDEE